MSCWQKFKRVCLINDCILNVPMGQPIILYKLYLYDYHHIKTIKWTETS